MSLFFRRPLGRLHGVLAGVRETLYRENVFSKVRIPVPVVSIGNLTFGGTGKTPIAIELAKFFLHKGKNVGLISRSYRASSRSPVQVSLNHPRGPEFFGDEPFLIAKTLPDIRVFVGPSKSDTALWAYENNPDLDVVLVDDGFQHQRLHRDFDLVLLDATDVSGLRPFPEGRARESLRALKRADFALFTKCNWAPAGQTESLKKILPPGLSFGESFFHTEWPAISGPVGVFAGLANSALFIEQSRKRYFSQVQKVWLFDDHHRYNDGDFAPMRDFLRSHPQALLLTTEKDAVKISDPEIKDRLRPASVKVDFKSTEAMFEKIGSLAR